MHVVAGSPFIIEIDELTSPKVFGDGLKQGVVGQPASFKVDSRGFPGELKITVEGELKCLPLLVCFAFFSRILF